MNENRMRNSIEYLREMESLNSDINKSYSKLEFDKKRFADTLRNADLKNKVFDNGVFRPNQKKKSWTIFGFIGDIYNKTIKKWLRL